MNIAANNIVEITILVGNMLLYILSISQKANSEKTISPTEKKQHGQTSYNKRIWHVFFVMSMFCSMVWLLYTIYNLREVNVQLQNDLKPAVKIHLKLPNGAIAEGFSLALNGEDNRKVIGVNIEEPQVTDTIFLNRSQLYKYDAASWIEYADNQQIQYRSSGYIELRRGDIVTYRINADQEMELIKK